VSEAPRADDADRGAVEALSAGVGPGEIGWCVCEMAGAARVALLESAPGGGSARVAGAWPAGPAPAAIECELVERVMADGVPRDDATVEDLEAAGALLETGPARALVAVRTGGMVALLVRTSPDPVTEAERRAFIAGSRLLSLGLRVERAPEGHLAARAGRVADLVDAGLALAGESTLDGVLERIIVTAREVLGARYAALGVLDEGGTELARFLTSGIDEATAEGIGPLPRGLGLLGAVIAERRPIRLERIADDPRAHGFPPGHPPMTSFLGVPIELRGEVYGNLYVTDKLTGAFSDEDERLARTLAAQAAVAVDNARRFESERRRAEELESALEVGQALLSVLDLDELLPLIARRARRLAVAETVAVGVREGEEIVLRYAYGAGALGLEGLRERADLEGLAERLRSIEPGEWEVVPLEIDAGLAGVLVAVRPRPFDPGARRLLRLLSTQAAVALSNARTFADERERLVAAAATAAANAQEEAAAEGFRRAVEAQEGERARIARELHDEAGQVLTGLSLHLRAIEEREGDPEVRASLAELRGSVAGVSASLRELITELRPSGLREYGLAGAIEHQAGRLREATGITVDVAVAHLPALSREVEIVVFRVVQEALTNIARHSGAAHASVVASADRGRLRVVVEDDGRGFDPGRPTRRLGLAGINERIAMLGGDLRIDSSPGAGTALTMDLDVSGEGA
jgi:signal transduction histidine kinase